MTITVVYLMEESAQVLCFYNFILFSRAYQYSPVFINFTVVEIKDGIPSAPAKIKFMLIINNIGKINEKLIHIKVGSFLFGF